MPSAKSVLQRSNTQYKFQAIGTYWIIDLVCDKERLRALKLVIDDRIEQFDKTYSRFRSDSLVTKISQTSGEYLLPDDGQTLLDFYFQMYYLTNGIVTPIIGQALADAGYDAHYRLTPRKIAPVPAWEEVIDYQYPCLSVSKPVLLDFGAAGKGYLVDIIAKIILDSGITDYTVDAGGDIYHYSSIDKCIRIGLEHPEIADQAIGVIELYNGSLCGSAGSRRKWDKYTHHLNPNNLISPTHVRATWVMAKSTLIADGVSTCLFFVEPELLLNNFSFEYLIVYEDYSFKKSPDFKSELFMASEMAA